MGVQPSLRCSLCDSYISRDILRVKEKRSDFVRVSFFLIGGLPVIACGFSFSGVGGNDEFSSVQSRRISSANDLISVQASTENKKNYKMLFN